MESARVPITATFFRFLASGNVWLSFFSSTIERAANLRSRARPSGLLSAASTVDSSTYGLSNNPNWYLASRIGRTAASNCASVTLPDATNLGRLLI